MSVPQAQETAAATAAAVTPPPTPAPHAAAAPKEPAGCENCQAPMSGPYCAQCGQKHGHAIHSVWHFLREMTEDLSHADARLWRTLGALLARPGALTREFLEGHRVRYLPPLRLYLVVSLVFFLLAEIAPHQTQAPEAGPGETPKLLAGPQGAGGEGPMTSSEVDRICHDMVSGTQGIGSRFGLTESRLQGSCHRMLADRETWYGVFLHNMERALFVLLPLLALFAWGLYWRPRHYYVEHLLFFLHNHACFFVLQAFSILASLVLPRGISDLLELAVWLYIPWYLYRSMRRVYGQGRLLTLAKCLALGVAYTLGGIGLLLGTAIYTAVRL